MCIMHVSNISTFSMYLSKDTDAVAPDLACVSSIQTLRSALCVYMYLVSRLCIRTLCVYVSSIQTLYSSI